TVLEAAEQLGIVVPHFCYHKALGAVGACRLCAVHIESGQTRGVQMSCLVEAADGMVVNTLEPTAVELRQNMIELLMINHPHDCPVCDEGGECQLQDMTIAGGHSIRNYRGKKRTYVNQDLGPFIEQEMNRCIQCYRCVRTYRDYFGGTDFGVMGSRNRVFYGRFQPGRLTSQFSGNLADVCPTGVFTDKTFRFKSRYWDLQESDSVCPHCSLGCATIPGARYRELQRIRSGINEEVNGHFICNRGRFGYGYVNNPLRPRRPKAGGTETIREEALRLSRAAIERLTGDLGGDSVAWLGSSRASLEANYLLKKLSSEYGSNHLVFECHPQRDRAARVWAARRQMESVSQEDLRQSDFILLVGSDPLNEAPMLAAAIRQAVRNGADVAVIDSRPVELPFQASHLVTLPEKLPLVLQALAGSPVDGLTRQEKLILEGVGQRLQQAKRPILTGGADLLQATGVHALLDLAEKFPKTCRTFLHLPGPNSYGAAMLAGEGPGFESILDGILDGDIRGLVCLESDPFREYPDPARIQAALSRLEVLIVMDYVGGEAVKRADVFLPTTAPVESAGTYVNCEGRMQPFNRVMEPGEPLKVTGQGDHPPRTFSLSTPGAEPVSAVSLLAEWLQRENDLDALRNEIATSDSRFYGLGETPAAVCASGGMAPPPPEQAFPAGDANQMQLQPIFNLLGSGTLAANSPTLDEVRATPHIIVSGIDAEEIGIEDGETVVLHSALGHLHIPVRIDQRAVPGLVLLPYFDRTGAGVFLPGAGTFSCRLLKEGK
ncbi:MAG: NADH dehydrogenase (quinone) subunit G, partial [Desulfuromonas sp.]